jgi:hypothetical protein
LRLMWESLQGIMNKSDKLGAFEQE